MKNCLRFVPLLMKTWPAPDALRQWLYFCDQCILLRAMILRGGTSAETLSRVGYWGRELHVIRTGSGAGLSDAGWKKVLNAFSLFKGKC